MSAPQKRIGRIANLRRIIASSKTSSLLHCLAGFLLLLFATSHFAFRRLPDSYHDLQNTVFPFLSNRDMYLIAALFEMGAGLCCLAFRGRDSVNTAILIFVGTMLWYRIAFNFTGGEHCSCLGLLGKLIHVTKTQESVIPVLTLFILTLTTTPWLLRLCQGLFRRRHAAPLLLCCLLFASDRAHAVQVTEIRGQYHYADYNPRTGILYTNQQGDFHFIAILAPTWWRILVTNDINPTLWSELRFDGTNTLTFCPYAPPFFTDEAARTNEVFVSITKSPYYLSAVSDWAFASIPWLTYGLDPAFVVPNKAGVVEIPLPWETSRIKPAAHGWDWKIVPSENGRFVAACLVLRRKQLDLASPSKELLRTELDYPSSIAQKNRCLDSLDYRHQIPDGFVETDYQCTDWFETNHSIFPLKAQIVRFSPSWKFPRQKSSLRAESVRVYEINASIFKQPPTAGIVNDYRYKKSNSSRIFRYAEYALQPGENWKSDMDPFLLLQANEWLKHGPRYDAFDRGKNILMWVLGIIFLVITPAVLALITKNRRTKGK